MTPWVWLALVMMIVSIIIMVGRLATTGVGFLLLGVARLSWAVAAGVASLCQFTRRRRQAHLES